MVEIIFQSLICFFAVYGVIQMGIQIYDYLYNFQSNNKKNDVYIIITVKNQQDTIEGIIRSVVWKSLNNNHGGIVPNILVVDMGSTDDTLKILDKLCMEYDFIEIADKEEYIKIMEKLMR
ncbi:MAG: hypothetical protein PWP27_1905 [Clostridiales bacterium]|jgi:cellulose synthase/poly-beta-1,6-N-acetylglucosamine synthase-like glycosyltransferase|nr:hypothetical protein [Clostridiales bacterium]MDK2934095.1 hypothetical protein [Clostridiales bacterium]